MCKVACLLAEQYPVCHLAGFAANIAVGQSLPGHWYLMRIIYIKWSEISWPKEWKTCWSLKAGIKSSMFCIQIMPFLSLWDNHVFSLSRAKMETSHEIKRTFIDFHEPILFIHSIIHPFVYLYLGPQHLLCAFNLKFTLPFSHPKLYKSIWAKKSSRCIHGFSKHPTLC